MTMTTTSYALLGLLALKPWSAYELAGQIRKSLVWVLPKSERHIYTEPKRLVAAGLATASEQANGRRRRTVYRITPAGRRALRAWLDDTPAPPELEFEGMLRVFFADAGTPDQLVQSLQTVSADAQARLRGLIHETERYRDDSAAFPERRHLLLLCVDFLEDYLGVLDRWASRSAAEVAGWSTTTDVAIDDGRVDELIARIHRQLARSAG